MITMGVAYEKNKTARSLQDHLQAHVAVYLTTTHSEAVANKAECLQPCKLQAEGPHTKNNGSELTAKSPVTI